MLKGIFYALHRAASRLLVPLRRKAYERRTTPFIFRAEKGLKFELYPKEAVDRHIFVYGIYERRMLRYFSSILPEQAVMLDIGANIGNHALFLADKCHEIHCFEPNPRAWHRLERNIELNTIENVIVHRFGLGDQDHVALFEDNMSGNLGASSFVRAGSEVGPGHSLLKLPIRQAGSAIADLNIPAIDFIKIDVEGMEPVILSALSQIIRKYRPIIVFEYSGHVATDADWNAVLDALPGYSVFDPRFTPDDASILAKAIWNITRAGMPDLKEVKVPARKWYECLLAVPDESPVFGVT